MACLFIHSDHVIYGGGRFAHNVCATCIIVEIIAWYIRDFFGFENEALQYEETHYSFVDKLLQSLAKNEYMNESSKLAGHVRKYVYKEPGIGIAVSQNSAIRQANFYVLRGVQAPAILVEMGFISSPKDKARLNNKSAQKHMGEGIGKGVVAYLKQEGKIK